jgi:Ran GTPase-activating protein (RanGAP) involved in mRNA processing and transport/GTPase SAR1 family protein
MFGLFVPFFRKTHRLHPAPSPAHSSLPCFLVAPMPSWFLRVRDNVEVNSYSGERIGDAEALEIARALHDPTARVRTLRLLYTSIGHRGGMAIMRALCTNSMLTRLDISCYGPERIGNDGAKAAAEALMDNTTSALTTLELTSCGIEEDGTKAMAEALKINSTLRALNLAYNDIGIDGATAMAAVLTINTTLMQLSLEGSCLGNDGATAIAKALKSNSTLKKLDLAYNDIGNDGATSIATALQSNSTLKTLDLSYNNIGNDGATAIAAALTINTRLMELSLEASKIGNDGATAIAKALKSNSTLKTLDVARNEIGTDGATAIAEALFNNTTMTILNLNFNGIYDDGAKALAEALKINTTLTTLSLAINEIGNDGATAIAGALFNNTTLKILNLSLNYIYDNGARAMAEVLTRNTTLTTLNLTDNDIGIDGVTAIAATLTEALKGGTSLMEFDLSQNIADDGAVPEGDALFKTIVGEIQKLMLKRRSQRAAHNLALVYGKDRPKRIRIMMSGPFGVGKTSLVRSLLGRAFVSHHDSTEGIDIEDHALGTPVDFRRAFQSWKHRQPEHEVTMPRPVLLEDVRHAALFDDEPAPEVIDGNSADNVDECSIDRSMASCRDPPAHYGLTNFDAHLTGPPAPEPNAIPLSMNVWDFAGQVQYHSMHQTFFRSNCLYVLVLDLRSDDSGGRLSTEDAMLSDAQKWLNSIVSCAGPDIGLIIVGTHGNAIEEADKRLESLVSLLEGRVADIECDKVLCSANKAIVDNKSGRGVDQLKKLLVDQAKCVLDRLDDIPLRWLRLLDLLDNLLPDPNCFCTPLDVIAMKAKTIGIVESEELAEALLFFDRIGDVIYVDDDGLKDWVFTRPQLLLNAMKTLVAHTNPTGLTRNQREELQADGLLRNDALSVLWSNSNFQNQQQLRSVLASAGLILDFGTAILVPSRLHKDSIGIPFRDNEIELTVRTRVSTHLPPNMFAYILAKFHSLYGVAEQELGLISESCACLCLKEATLGHETDSTSYRLIIIEEKLQHVITFTLRAMLAKKLALVNQAVKLVISLHRLLRDRFRWVLLDSFVETSGGGHWSIWKTTPENPAPCTLVTSHINKYGIRLSLEDVVYDSSHQAPYTLSSDQQTMSSLLAQPVCTIDGVEALIAMDLPPHQDELENHVRCLLGMEKVLVKWLAQLSTLEVTKSYQPSELEIAWIKRISRFYHKLVPVLQIYYSDHHRILCKSTPFTVFVSHAGEDKDAYASPLARYLEQNNVRTFLDRSSLRLGGDPENEMIHAAVTSQYFGVSCQSTLPKNGTRCAN